MVGNQLPILLISFSASITPRILRWESVTNPLDKLYAVMAVDIDSLGISYQSS